MGNYGLIAARHVQRRVSRERLRSPSDNVHWKPPAKTRGNK